MTFPPTASSGLTATTTKTASSPSLARTKHSDDFLVVVCNFTPQPRYDYWVGVPKPGYYKELLNSDASQYGGSGLGNDGGKSTPRLG